MLAGPTEARNGIGRHLPWLCLVAVSIFALECYQSEEGLLVFMFGALLLLAVHGTLFTFARYGPTCRREREPHNASVVSCAIVFVGAAWVGIRFVKPDWLHSTGAYLDAFMIGGLSGSLYFRKRSAPGGVANASQVQPPQG
jgi:predicted membrane channel-forming protein YqfA (hemolysin III family)